MRKVGLKMNQHSIPQSHQDLSPLRPFFKSGPSILYSLPFSRHSILRPLIAATESLAKVLGAFLATTEATSYGTTIAAAFAETTATKSHGWPLFAHHLFNRCRIRLIIQMLWRY